MFRFLASLAFLLISLSATAAEIQAVPEPSKGVVIISVYGDIESGDDLKFINIALPIEKGVVLFNSNGGNLLAALGIGRTIRLKEFWTTVPNKSVCASACGLAWLAGVRRFVDESARVGFHAAYVQNNGETQETGSGNALTGAYLNQLGLTQSAIYYVTQAAPQDMNWLTAELAKEVGIEMTILVPNESDAIAPKIGSDSPAQAPTQTDTDLYLLAPLAEQGDVVAQFNLGILYDNGQGVPQDYAEAMKWYRKAAEQGNAAARFNLGAMYSNGQGVPQDYVHSHMWYNLAAAGGDADAVKKRDTVSTYMTADQIAEAQRLASEWMAAHSKP